MSKMETKKTNQKMRSLPIPREVNFYILQKYGASYYNCQDYGEKIKLLKDIETCLISAGYNHNYLEIERRLKNMKSHYRRKKNDLKQGFANSIGWEYFEILDAILNSSETKSSDSQSAKKCSDSIKSTEDVKPQDLSKKKTRILEFNHNIRDVSDQIRLPALETTSKQMIIAKISESLRAVEDQRLKLDKERVNLEIRRFELDTVGHQLTEQIRFLCESAKL